MNNHNELVTMPNERFDHDDFDGLLEESSLSTTAARKNQTETPIEVHQRVQDRLRDSKVARRQGDIDDFLFHLVRLYSAPNDTETTSSELMNIAFSTRLWMPRHEFRRCWDSDFARHVRADVVPGIVQTLLDKEVFSYLRQDVARSMVSLCFNSRTPLPLVILSACASAVPASSFKDELADAFMNVMLTERAALPADSWLKQPVAIYHAGLREHRQTQQALAMTKPIDGTAQTPRPQYRRRTTELLRRAGDRDPRAWEEIVHRYRGVVLEKVRSFGLQDADAHDAVQMTWLRLAENCHRILLPEQLAGWLATTASRECLRILRQHAHHTPAPPHAVVEQLADPSVGPEQHAIDADTARLLWSLIATLSPRRQMLLRELFVDNPRPYAEVARNTGIPAGDIGPTRARALTQLRRKLTEAHPELVALQDHDNEIRGVWSQDDQLLAAASNDSTTHIRDTNGNELLVPHHSHNDAARVMARSPDGRELVAISRDYTVRICRTDDGNELVVLQDLDDKIREVTRDPGSGTLATVAILQCCADTTTRFGGVMEDNDELLRQESERLARLRS
jgi:RNA polymerase sigma factor (sigma-70 family)